MTRGQAGSSHPVATPDVIGPEHTALVSDEMIRATLARMGVSWRRAKEWITSPDPKYARKKGRRDRLIRLAQRHPDWLLGFADEVWWSRLASRSARLAG